MDYEFPELAAIRLGYGLSPHMAPPADVEAVLDGVADAAPDGNATSTNEANALGMKFREFGEARKSGNAKAKQEYIDLQRDLKQMKWTGLQNQIARGIDATSGFGERLVQFWTNHFTIRTDATLLQPLALAYVDEAIRANLNGRFADMLYAADTHPMMLIYLDQNSSVGPGSENAQRQKGRNRRGLNENLAREALELHSIGAGGSYTQKDVRQLAELLTGLTYNQRHPERFKPDLAEPGAEHVLGKTYGGDGPAKLDDIRAVFEDLAAHPDTANHLARKLVVHFYTDTPDDAVVQDIAAVWRDSGGNLPQVYRALVMHPALADTFRQKARQPIDYITTALRALGVTGRDVRAFDRRIINRVLVDGLQQMGQKWGQPLGPNGWAEESKAWITPQGVAARITWAMMAPTLLMVELPDARTLLRTALGGTISENLAWAIPKAESQREGVALVLASNDLNRR